MCVCVCVCVCVQKEREREREIVVSACCWTLLNKNLINLNQIYYMSPSQEIHVGHRDLHIGFQRHDIHD